MPPPKPPSPQVPNEEEEEEEDYMSMAIEEPSTRETFTQKKLRKQREAESRARVPSKSERAAAEAARRDEALSTSTLDPKSKGFQMMAKLGFKAGDVLGKPAASSGGGDAADENDNDNDNGPKPRGRAEPLHITMKEDRAGIGLDSERKRKIREEADDAVKRVKAEQGDYRERMRAEREERRVEGQVLGAQKVAERLDTEADAEAGEEEPLPADDDGQSKEKKKKVKPTSSINVLYRGLVRAREDTDRDILARHALNTSLPSSFFPNPRLPGYEDDTLTGEDKEALGTKRVEPATLLEQEEDGDEEDAELEEFNALEPAERLQRLVMYLRQTYRYCFWCKFRYEDEDLDGCPGVTEEDHD